MVNENNGRCVSEGEKSKETQNPKDNMTGSEEERKSKEPKDIENVEGDGNCFFRCLSKAMYGREDEHREVRGKIVKYMKENEDVYKEYTGPEFDKHIENMAHSTGGEEIWATEAEILAANECYEIDIFVYTKTGVRSEWHRFARNGECQHKRKYIKLLHTGSHYKLVHDKGRPCKCGKQSQRDEIIGVTLTDEVLEQEAAVAVTPHSDTENNGKSLTPQIQERSQRRIAKIRSMAQQFEEIYNEIIHFKSYNMFMPSPGQAMNEMKKEMTRLINNYVMDSTRKNISLKMLMSMPKLLLQKEHRRASAKENNNALKRRMHAWQEGNFEELFWEACTIQERLQERLSTRKERDKARNFRKKMEMGHVRQAARMLQNDSQGGILPIDDNTIKQLQEKHPKGAEAEEEDLMKGQKGEVHTVTFNRIDGIMVKRAAIDTKGSAGPSGMDANIWRMLLTSRRSPTITTDLRNAIAHLARKMCTEECQHLEPILNSRLIPLRNSHNGVRPIGIGEVLRRIIGRCVMKVLKEDVQEAAGNLQTCTGKQAGAEAAIHAMRNIFNEEDCEAVLLIDASNAFNTINRKAMLHNIGIICPVMSKFVENTYKVAPRLILSEGNDIKSNEGTTQGDPIAMAVYALGLSVLQRKIDQQHTGAKHVAFADDIAGAGSLQAVKKFWEETKKKGPSLGYHPNASKSCLIVKPEKETEAQRLFSGTGIRITVDGHKHLGAVIGSENFKDTYMKDLVDGWILEIQELTKIAKTEPHAAYTNFIFSMKHKWNYAMRTIPNISQHMQALESTIKSEFLPTLLMHEVSDNLRNLIALPARMGGMGIINPVTIADAEYENSTSLTRQLTELIIKQDNKGKINQKNIQEIKRKISKEKEKSQKVKLQELQNQEEVDITQRRKIEMNNEKGASNWLSTMPIKEQGFSLTKDEFHTAVAIRYGLPISRLPEYCVCGTNFSVDHSMVCKKGGFISQRHNELRDMTHELLSEVCSNVEKEPLLQPLSGEVFKYSTTNTRDNARLDLSAEGFWTRGERAFFDVRVFDPVAPSYIDQRLQTAHRLHEEQKRRMYEERVINVEHASFTPLIFTIAGGMGKEAQKVYSNIAESIAMSRGQSKSVVVAWMRSKISFSLLRSAVRCVRGTRSKTRNEQAEVQHTDIPCAVSVGRITTKKW